MNKEDEKKLKKNGYLRKGNLLFYYRKNKLRVVDLKKTMIYKVGKNLISLNVIFDLILIWLALYFYIKIFADISRVSSTIELSANGKFIPERLPEYEVEGVEKIIENFKDVYLKLLQTEKKVKKKTSFESLGLTAAGVIHDFKNSLSYILIMLYRIKSLVNNSEAIEILSLIDNKINELKRALEDILSAVKDGRDLKIEDVDIVVLKNGFEKEFSVIAKDLNIDFSVCFDSNLLGKTVRVNPIQLKNSIENLLHNSIHALKSSNKNEKKIGLEFTLDGDFLHIAVWDNGIGLSNVNEDIFESFVSDTKDGIGLGLNTVKEFCESVNGKVNFTVDNGYTRFNLFIPFKPELKE